ncbi:MAG: TerB family tellurite resistance protein [Polyangiales bacterium]
MIFGGKDKPNEVTPEARDRLAEIVERYLADADDATRRIVTAVAGLLAKVAYADGHYSAQEEATIQKELSRVHGLSQAGVDAICGLLADQISHVALLGDHDWTRDLLELADRELRLEVLEVLIEMAVADDVLKHEEQTQLRRLAKALSLTQDDYNALQAKHRDKLSTLR